MAISRKRIVFYSLLIFVLATSAVFFLAYYQLRSLGGFKALAVEKLEELTRREVKIGDVEIDIVRGLSIRLKDMTVKSRRVAEPELAARDVWVVVQLLPLLDKRVEVKKIIIQGLSLRVVRDAEGRFSFGDVKNWIAQPSESNLSKIFKASFVNQLTVEDGTVNFHDHFNRSAEDSPPLILKHISFSARKKFLDSSFQFALNGEGPGRGSATTFQISGTVDNFSQNRGFAGVSIDGKVRVHELHVASFRPYLKKVLAKTPQDSWLSLDSNFSRNSSGALKSEGTLRYSFKSDKNRATLRDARVPHRGGFEYKVSLNGDSIYVEELKSESLPFKFATKGALEDFFSDEPFMSFELVTDPFLISKSIDYPPLNFFPEKYHASVQSRFKNGSMKIKSLKFAGSLEQFRELGKAENQDLIFAELEMENVDLQSPLAALKNVTGTLSVDKGNAVFHIAKARYENQIVTDARGTIDDFVTRPIMDFEVENEVDVDQFYETLEQVFKNNPLLDSFAVYDNLDGTAKVRVNVKGSLDDFDKLAVTGKISLKNVSLNEKGFKPRVENINGNIIYTHTPAADNRKDARRIPVIKFDNLAGDFSKSSFSDMHGEIGFGDGELTEKMSATYKLDSGDLRYVLPDDSEGALADLKDGLDFTSGDLILKYRSQGNPTMPETEKEWGKIEIKNLAMKYPDRLMTVSRLNGSISYGDGKIKLENWSGRYGDSAFRLEGEIDRGENIAKLEYALRLQFSKLVHTDLKNVPLFENFKFTGPARVSLDLHGDADSFGFEHQADLTQAGYQIPGVIDKQPEVSNQFTAKGSVLKNGGVVLDSWSYELDGDRVAGTASIPNTDSPEFTVSMVSDNFKVNPSRQFFRFLDAEIDAAAAAAFNVTGAGSLDDLHDAKFKGEIKLKRLKIQPKNLQSPLTVNARLRFAEDFLDIRSGSIESDHSRVQFFGSYQRGDAPSLDLNLTGERLDVDGFLPAPQGEENSLVSRLNQSEFFAKGKGKIKFALSKLGYKLFTVDHVAGDIVLNNRKIEMKDLVFASNASIRSGGQMWIDAAGVCHFEVSVQAQDMKTENLFSFFGDIFENSLSGDVKMIDARLQGDGKDWQEILQSLSGNLSLNVQSGNMNTEKLKEGVRRLFASLPPTDPIEQGTLSPFKHLAGDFVAKDGVFETQNFVIETENRRTSIVGTFDLVNNQMDTVVGVAPLAGLDRLLAKIPLVGKIITGGDEKSILKTYYTVTGDFDDPEITVAPFTSLGKQVMGILQALLETPQELIAPIVGDTSATQPPSTTPADN